MTQGRPAWQSPTYTPPGGTGGPQGYAAPPPPDQTYTVQQGQGQAYGYQPPSYAQSGQGAPVPPPQWQAAAPAAPAQPRQRAAGDKGFVGSLFDFSFTSLVTPKIIRALYILFTIWTAIVSLIIVVVGFETGSLAGGLFVTFVIVPVFVLLTLGIYRVVLEAFMVMFRIYEETKKIRENTDSQA
jgi:hypothetical protein